MTSSMSSICSNHSVSTISQPYIALSYSESAYRRSGDIASQSELGSSRHARGKGRDWEIHPTFSKPHQLRSFATVVPQKYYMDQDTSNRVVRAWEFPAWWSLGPERPLSESIVISIGYHVCKCFLCSVSGLGHSTIIQHDDKKVIHANVMLDMSLFFLSMEVP